MCPVAAAPADSTAALQAAIKACAGGGTVALGAGTFAISSNLPVRAAEVITGAGANATFIVQHGQVNIFQITAPGVTIENLNLDTATYNPGPPILNNPKPGVLFSNSSHTSIINVTGEAGTGFGMRVTGPSPCASYPTTGTVISNVNMTTQGVGGFAAVDVDCTNGAQLSNITIHGGILALFRDENVTLSHELFTPGALNITCEPAAIVTGPSNSIDISDVTSSGGGVRVRQAVSALVMQAIAVRPGC
jgi:hypothetical protein